MMYRFLMSFFVGAGALFSLEAAPAIQVAMQPSTLASVAAFCKDKPNLTMAGLGLASLAYAKYCAMWEDADENVTEEEKKQYEKRDHVATLIGATLLGTSIHSVALNKIKQWGYLPLLTNTTAAGAAMLAVLGSHVLINGYRGAICNGIDRASFGWKCKPYYRQMLLAGLEACLLAGVYLAKASV